MTIPQIRELLNSRGVKHKHLTDTQVQQMTQILAFAGIHPPTPSQIQEPQPTKPSSASAKN